MEIKLRLNTENAKNEIAELKQFIESKNPKGVKLSLETKSHEEGKLGIDWINLINIGLTTSGAGIALKGFFDLLKAYLVDLKKHKLTTETDKRKHEKEIKSKIIEKYIDNSLATIILKDKDGNEVNMPINRFDMKEIDEILKHITD